MRVRPAGAVAAVGTVVVLGALVWLDRVADTATYAELLWTAVAMIGMFVAGGNLRTAMGDVQDLRELKLNGVRERSLRRMTHVHGTIAACLGLFAAAGILSAGIPPSNPRVPVPPAIVVVTICLLVAEALLTGLSISLDRSRDALLRMVREGVSREQTGELHAGQVIADTVHARELRLDSRVVEEVAEKAAAKAAAKAVEKRGDGRD